MVKRLVEILGPTDVDTPLTQSSVTLLQMDGIIALDQDGEETEALLSANSCHPCGQAGQGAAQFVVDSTRHLVNRWNSAIPGLHLEVQLLHHHGEADLSIPNVGKSDRPPGSLRGILPFDLRWPHPEECVQVAPER